VYVCVASGLRINCASSLLRVLTCVSSICGICILCSMLLMGSAHGVLCFEWFLSQHRDPQVVSSGGMMGPLTFNLPGGKRVSPLCVRGASYAHRFCICVRASASACRGRFY
jgi:hypothetical protein